MTKPGKAPGSGMISRKETSVHKYRYGGMWFRTEEALEYYRWTQTTRRAAKRANWPHETINELKAFDKYREDIREESRLKKQRDAENRMERDRIRQELKLPKTCGIRYARSKQHAATSLEYARRLNNQEMTADQKVALIKKMIEERTPIQDFMIRTSQLVGAKL